MKEKGTNHHSTKRFDQPMIGMELAIDKNHLTYETSYRDIIKMLFSIRENLPIGTKITTDFAEILRNINTGKSRIAS